MTARQKFWLKVAMAATFPVWIIPLFVLMGSGIVVYLVWLTCSDIVDGSTRESA